MLLGNAFTDSQIDSEFIFYLKMHKIHHETVKVLMKVPMKCYRN